jgi:hypothetical protein
MGVPWIEINHRGKPLDVRRPNISWELSDGGGDAVVGSLM